MPKHQIRIAIVYALLAFGSIQWVKHTPSLAHILDPFCALAGSPLFFGLAYFGLQNGWALGKFAIVERETRPKAFWAITLFQCALGLFLALAGLRGLFLRGLLV
jgi:hypothetical protein